MSIFDLFYIILKKRKENEVRDSKPNWRASWEILPRSRCAPMTYCMRSEPTLSSALSWAGLMSFFPGHWQELLHFGVFLSSGDFDPQLSCKAEFWE